MDDSRLGEAVKVGEQRERVRRVNRLIYEKYKEGYVE